MYDTEQEDKVRNGIGQNPFLISTQLRIATSSDRSPSLARSDVVRALCMKFNKKGSMVSSYQNSASLLA